MRHFFKKSNIKKAANPRGVISIAMVLSVLAIISAIALGSSFIVSGEVRISSSANESVAALYYAETGIEKAILDVKNGVEPTATRCNPPSYTNWTVISNIKYCLIVTGLVSDGSISQIKSIGEFGSARRSVEITF
ncbi:pilus assembly PilX N-terminal domain-containing protein [Patescibacteria group bacterium]|nr:pilus assembly PilX N-terminal domain-containing protein [Patescibacteria group bacterium]MBU4000362.1 pilus assembly PilX N-terminal domain-containing protein [Patescibacteria group bacterium]MBU4057034.1 pilus assembly PilX N-terminal domain-containing protein [Patescibacteria group bacterium]MBU4368588.1 pilus assembly PilX N-terminal domain-containing protein [Patescibacteria group bacterium]